MNKRLALIIGGLFFSLVLLINACGFGLIAIMTMTALDNPRLEYFQKEQGKYKADKTPCKNVVFSLVDVPEGAVYKAAGLCECLVPLDLCRQDACESIAAVQGRRSKYSSKAGDSIAEHETIKEQKIFVCRKKLHKGDLIKQTDLRLFTIPSDSVDGLTPLAANHAERDIAAGQVLRGADVVKIPSS